MYCFCMDNYSVFFIPEEDIGIVTIVRIMYNGQNVKEH